MSKFKYRSGTLTVKKLSKDIVDDIMQAAEGFMTEEMEESQRRTPVASGDLQSDHRVVGPDLVGNKIELAIAVGEGDSEGYAYRVHEDTEAFHKTGQAKFLESTLNESSGSALERINAKRKMKI